MTRLLPAPWYADKFSGGYVVRDANGFAVAYVYGSSTEAEAMKAKQMTMDEARRVASNMAKLPDVLKRGE
jgi:K+/H+ antiporter YhaU regulatory subunit KhtT